MSAGTDRAGDGPAVSVGLAAAAYAALSIIYFLPALLPGGHIFGTDYLAGGYFFQEFISERLAAGELPKWVPYVYGGLPLFANPGSAFFPFRFLADWLFPVTGVLATLFLIQFALGGLGMFLLCREVGARPWVAFVAGLAFEFSGLPMSYVYAGHDGRVIVITLAPLFLYFLHRGVRTGALAPFVGAATTLGFALLSFQIQNNYYLLLAGGIWAVFLLFHHRLHRSGRALAGRVALGLGAVAFGFAMAAVNFLPFLDYVDASPRGGEEARGYEYAVQYSMPPAELLALAVPEQAGASVADPATGEPLFPRYQGDRAVQFKLHTEYVGVFVLALALLGAVYARRDRYWWFFAGLAAFALTLSFGGFTPLYRLYYELLPGTKRFRTPDIAFYLVTVALTVMAALTLERLARLRAGEPGGVGRRSGRGAGGNRDRADAGAAASPTLAVWLVAGLAGLAVLGAGIASGGAAADASDRAAGWLRFAVFTGLLAGALWVWLTGRISSAAALAALGLLTVVDLWIVDRRFFHVVDPPETMFRADGVVAALLEQPGPYRVWAIPSPPLPGNAIYPRQGNYLMHFDVEQAGGEHGNQLQRWNEYVGAGERTYVDWRNLIEAPWLMDGANIRYLLVGMELGAPNLREIHRGPMGLVYENTTALPRAWLVGSARVVGAEDGALPILREPGFDPRREAVLHEAPTLALEGAPVTGSARVVRHEPDEVVLDVSADRPALLVLADNYYEGWQATVDGAETPVLRANHTFRAVSVAAGRHEVVFRFAPPGLRAGFALYVGALALVTVYGLWLAVGAWRSRHGEAGAEEAA